MGSSESENNNNNSNIKKDISTDTCCSSESTAAQEHSIFGDISNLSTGQLRNDAAMLQGFLGINSPPNVSTLPHINPQSSLLNRQEQFHTSSSGFSQDNVEIEKINIISDDPESTSQSSIAVASSDPKGSGVTAFTQLQPFNNFVGTDKLLVGSVYEESVDPGSREHPNDAPKTLESDLEQKDSMKDNYLASGTSTRLLEQAGECVISDVSQIKDENHQFISTSEVSSDLISKYFVDHPSEQLDCGGPLIKADHIQSSILRRCLQFDECQQKAIRESSVSCNMTENQINISGLSQDFSPETPSNRHVVHQSEPASTMCFPSSASITVSQPRGIGLHLNSIVASPPGDLVAGMHSSTRMVKLGGKSLIRSGSVDARTVSFHNAEKISSISEGDLHVTESVDMTTSNKLILPNSAIPLDDSILLNSASEEPAESTEPNQPVPNRGRKQSTVNQDECKRCSCKKSKCLKLYCDCFAAGLYCAESCSCQGCFNRPEHENKVVEARQQIESRNPLAFAPRVMQHVTNSPTNSGESGEPVAQSLLRHKKGCNCKKSMCLKKYCECYQANVGCSDDCRCEGCKNVYGKKPDYHMSTHITNKRTIDETSEEMPDQKRKLLIISRNHVPHEKVNDSPVAVPVTPALQCSDLRKKELKSLLPSGRYVLSPDFDLHTRTSSGKCQSSSGSSLVQHSSTNPAEANQFSSSIHGGLVNLCDLTQLPNPLQMNPMVCSSNVKNIPEAPLQSPFRNITKSKTLGCLPASAILGYDSTDNDTPLILRDSSVPVKSVKVSSPNKKRVSPPHNHLNELQPSFSGGLRSSRKFIFRSVPKFPPLSPCVDSNDRRESPDETRNRSIDR